ncbi:hypothetical protein, partial [Planomonospora algeriensis]
MLDPAGRDRLLRAVTDRLGDPVDLALDAPPELLALWTAADAAGLAALEGWGISVPSSTDARRLPQPGRRPGAEPLAPSVPSAPLVRSAPDRRASGAGRRGGRATE